MIKERIDFKNRVDWSEGWTPPESAQSERKSAPSYGDEPNKCFLKLSLKETSLYNENQEEA
ncbi:hypothetical protein ACIQZG_06510 [Lysinibacillus sp. NPDC096418]|uniref:hypothetical protein n=1 Tax=Lysinibacillus sp. NPDC096418 TaxID=3364138 RepID=UPI003826E947